jgi:DNA-directed RNA polymerase subunit RPC12/RpoP
MRSRVSFNCLSCRTRLRASSRFVGRSFTCPKCGEDLVVPALIPAEEEPVLVLDDGYGSRGSRYSEMK